MELYLVRHAIALDAEPGQSDDARPLSKPGIERFRAVAKGLAALEVGFDFIYHSPKLRAVQTAELLEQHIRGRLIETGLLAQPPSPELLQEIRGQAVALVGHEPWMAALCAWLVTGEATAGYFVFKKGGVAHLEGSLTPAGMRLKAFYPPKVWQL